MQLNLVPGPSLLAIVAIFIVNYFVVRKFLFRPVNAVINDRENEIKTAERLHEESLARFNEATSKMEAQLHAAKREASLLRDRFRADAAAHRQGVVEKTQTQAKQIVAEADEKLSNDVKVARDKIASESETLARLAAERILGRAV